MISAGVDGQKTCLLVEDHQITESVFLEDINSLLSAGEIPGLFNTQELDAMLNPLKEQFQSNGFASKNLYEFFFNRVRSNLHIVLVMDPAHPLFTIRCESNPALYTRCNILWFGRWSREGMLQVPALKLASNILAHKLANGENVSAKSVLENVLYIHTQSMAFGATPLKYIAFLENYQKIYEQNRVIQNTQRQHLVAGLKKLSDAAQLVDVLSKDAQAKQEQVTKKQQEADQALEQITVRMQQATERKNEVEILQKSLGGEEEKLRDRKISIENELKEIEPVLASAKEAVSGIKKDNLNEIRAFRMPPPQIRNVLAGVLTLLKQEDLTWENMRKFLGSPTVKDEIMNFDPQAVDPNTRDNVLALIKKNQESFDHKKILHVNVAAAPLAAWVKACVRYSQVLETIQPLRNEFEEANRKLDGARKRLKQCEIDLAELDKEVKDLKVKFGKTTGEAAMLKDQLEKINATLGQAKTLLDKLSGEKNRWEQTVKTLSAGLDGLVFHALLAAGSITYLGGQAEDIRMKSMNDWKLKTNQKDFDFQSFMATESEYLKWKAEGLPSDPLSMQNGLVIIRSSQTPFIIDPNGQAAAWLRTTLTDNNKSVEVIMQQDPKFVNAVENSVRFGKTLIVTEADGVMPILFPVLRRDLFKQGPRMVVQIGDKQVDFNENFRVFLVTRDPSPDLSPDAAALVNLVNFTVTRSGLEGQLLALTLNHEKPELEKKKSELLAGEEKLKIQLADLEKKLLDELAASEGNILENTKLIESLNQTKSQSLEIANSLSQSKEIQADLDRQREVYRSIAKNGSILYFLVSELNGVNNMYEFSLPSFLRYFHLNMEAKEIPQSKAGDSRSEETRVNALVRGLILSIFNSVTRSLFKADRLMFAMHLVHSLFPELFSDKEWDYFSGSLVSDVDPSSSSSTPLPNWAPKDAQINFNKFSQTFPNLSRSLRFNDDGVWGVWVKKPKCELEWPINGDKQTTPFQRLLVIHTFRPDRLMNAMQRYVCESLRIDSIAPPPLNLSELAESSPPLEPILFLCEGGTDPTQELEEFAEKKLGGKDKFYQIALGSGQTDHAMEMLNKAAREGTWLLLKNLHLVIHWLPLLEKGLKALHPHERFRLWLTTEQHHAFPPILLQQSVKISYEAPPGVKQNLLRSYEAWDAAYIAKGGVARAQILFSLAWFHAIVQERRTYLPQGWTKYYEFSFADLRSAADIIDNICNRLGAKSGAEINPEAIPWNTIWGLLKFAIYGGRVDNDHDVRVLVTYLRKFFYKDILSSGAGAPMRKLTPAVDLPSSNKIDDYKALIRKLSDIDVPGLFNLPENIEGSVQQSQASYVTGQLRKLAVSSSLSAKFDRDIWRTQLTPLLQLWEKLTGRDGKAPLARPQRLRKKEEDYLPTDSFVVLENQKCYELITMIDQALTSLNSVLFSSGLLTPDNRTDGQSLLGGEVPWRWAKHWVSSPSDPASWIKELVQRKMVLTQWIQKADSGQLLNSSLSLNELFTPRTFLNAIRQQTARTLGAPIDKLKLIATWDESLLPASAKLRVRINDLFIQGCGFDPKGGLVPLSADAPLLSRMPPCTIAYVHKDEADPYKKGSCLETPVYVAPSREEFVAEIKVPSNGTLDRWVLTGAAIFLTDFK